MTVETEFTRTERVLGEDSTRLFAACSVLVVGIGGVGGSAAETLARLGIGKLTLLDRDIVSVTNINRQAAALHSTLGKSKADVMAARVTDINPGAVAVPLNLFYLPETADQVDLTAFDYVVDAVDNVTAKLELIQRCLAEDVPVISSMGTGNKTDPLRFQIADISKTEVCPLAKVMRRELKKRGVERGVKVLFSTEAPLKDGVRVPGSVPFVPPVAGMLIAREVALDLLERKLER